MGRLVSKIRHFVRDPKRYLWIAVFKILGSGIIIRFYRRFMLPRNVKRISCKDKINVVFLAMNTSMWKYDAVYKKLAKDVRFNPMIVTAMRRIPDMELRLQEQETMVSYYSNRGFTVIRGFDPVAKDWISLSGLCPDIIFYTQPYNGVIEHSFEYYCHFDSLFCYSPYAFLLGVAEWNWNSNLVQYCWKIYYACESHLQVCAKLSRIGRSNAVAAGYSFEEEYSECVKDKEPGNNAWRNDNRKRVIWAPHHSIKEREMFKVSSFLEISDLMVRIRDEYKEKVVFAFKPHPVLKTKLHSVWGQEKTDAYYEDWAKSESSFDAQGDYYALFAGSDAMIHCSGSFIVEYLYTGKPVAYVYSKTRNPPDIGPIGDAALGAHYPMHCEADIRRFIEEVVLGENDKMRNIRQETVAKYLKSPNGKRFSENVYDSIVSGLGL